MHVQKNLASIIIDCLLFNMRIEKVFPCRGVPKDIQVLPGGGVLVKSFHPHASNLKYFKSS